MAGFIYVMSNIAMPGLINFGTSAEDPMNERDKLYAPDVPEPFYIEYYAFIEKYLEQHQSLLNQLENSTIHTMSIVWKTLCKRVRPDRDFFNFPLTRAVGFIRNHIEQDSLIFEKSHMETSIFLTRSYKGCFEDGYPHGRGKLTLPGGSLYEGDFEDGKYCGESFQTNLNPHQITGAT